MSECEGLLYITIVALAVAILLLGIEKLSTRRLLKEVEEYAQTIEPAGVSPGAGHASRVEHSDYRQT